MIVDTSVFIAILDNEPEREQFLMRLASSASIKMSAIALFETSVVLVSRLGEHALEELDRMLAAFEIQIVPVDEEQANLARAGFLSYGKGRNPAQLNLADCLIYALAKQTGEPLLFKGNDFGKTDLLLA